MRVHTLTDSRLVLQQKSPLGCLLFLWSVLIVLGLPVTLFMSFVLVAGAAEGETRLQCDRPDATAVTCHLTRQSYLPFMRRDTLISQPQSAEVQRIEHRKDYNDPDLNEVSVEYRLMIHAPNREVSVIAYSYETYLGLLETAAAQTNVFLAQAQSPTLNLVFRPDRRSLRGPAVLLGLAGGPFLLLPGLALALSPTITIALDRSTDRAVCKVQRLGLQTSQKFPLAKIDTVRVQTKAPWIAKGAPLYQVVLELKNRQGVRAGSYSDRAEAEATVKTICQFLGWPT